MYSIPLWANGFIMYMAERWTIYLWNDIPIKSSMLACLYILHTGIEDSIWEGEE